MIVGLLAGSVISDRVNFGGDPVENDHGLTSSPILEMKRGVNRCLLIARHSMPPAIPPHRVNHRANIRALSDAGAEVIVSICSCGALRSDIEVPSFAVPGDYIDLFSIATFFDGSIEHATPGIDPDLRGAVLEAFGSAGISVTDGGIYIQTRGPRLETRAEVNVLAGWGDYVGMNMGPEATLSKELGIPFASILTVDNYANGIGEGDLDFRDILEGARSRWDELMNVIGMIR